MIPLLGSEESSPTPLASLERFNRLLIQAHVQYALVDGEGELSGLPRGLASIFQLNGTPEQLQSFYDATIQRAIPWSLSPELIHTFDKRQAFLGDTRFQRSYMNYFSQRLGLHGGAGHALISSELLVGSKPLIFGLFGGLGRPLMLLSDALELQSPILLVESLVLAAVDWSEPLYRLLTDPRLDIPPADGGYAPPETILRGIAFDGRFSGIMRRGPGFQHVGLVLENAVSKAAVLEYARRLDMSDPAGQIPKLSSLAAHLLCGTHKRSRPEFDYHMAQLVNLVYSLSKPLQVLNGNGALVRGVWLLFILVYVTQLRPVVDESLVGEVGIGQEDLGWDSLLSEFRGQTNSVQGKHLDTAYLGTLRSLCELGKHQGHDERLLLLAAWKLRLKWRCWVGMGRRGEETLNIRL